MMLSDLCELFGFALIIAAATAALGLAAGLLVAGLVLVFYGFTLDNGAEGE